MKRKKLMTVIHIVIATAVVGGALALCGCSGSNAGNAWAGGQFASNNGGCVSACAGCAGSTASNIACSGLTGCFTGCVNFAV